MKPHYLHTGQTLCYDGQGMVTDCAGSGLDADANPGLAWPEPRFEPTGADTVLDRLTGLVWAKNADLAGFPLTWPEALDLAAGLNRDELAGRQDWRLPNRREMRSLISHQTKNPALPQGHPFANVRANWFWTSTTSAVNPAYAWYVHLAGGRMFYGRKDQSCLVWPVRGQGNGALARTGQTACFDVQGRDIPCPGTGQDGELRLGAPWPEPRFEPAGEDNAVLDRLTGLTWAKAAHESGPTDWPGALAAASGRTGAGTPWRLPTINELESLVDASQCFPALPRDHPFRGMAGDPGPVFWSSTSSAFEPDWSMALYLGKGAVGVGHKTRGDRFLAWPVRG